ncbi:MAG: hypothetical protein IM638_19705 [Bacteroidetes bacterium]|nr:hypothetical protein [Bacteroidota bacterium]
MNNHIIRRFELELQVPDKTHGLALQDEILNGYKEQIIQSVSSVLDEFAGPDEFLTINRLVIDTGQFSESRFHEMFIGQLHEVLYTQLEKLTNEARQNPGEEVRFSDTDAHGNSIEVALQLKSKARSTQEIIAFWLLYGALPWQSSQHNRIEELVTSTEGSAAMPALLAELARQRHYSGFRRLALQLRLPALLCLFAEERMRRITALLHKYISNRAGLHTAAELLAMLLYIQAQWPAASWPEILALLRQEVTQTPAPVYAHIMKVLFDDPYSQRAAQDQLSRQPLQIPSSALSPAEQAELAQVIVQTATHADSQKTEILQQLRQQHSTHTLPDNEYLLVQNAGLVLLFPFISTFLTRTGHLQNKKFVSQAAQAEAAVLLQLLVWDKNNEAENTDQFEESQLLLNKILTGLSPDAPLPALHQFDPAQLQTYLEEADNAVAQAIKSWELLKRTTVPAFRKMFLQHEGKLKSSTDGWDLFIERDSFDVLIDKLPWPISIIRYPWTEKVVYVTW